MLLCTRQVQNFARADVCTGLQMLLLDAPYMTLLKQRLRQQSTKLLLQQFLYYFILF